MNRFLNLDIIQNEDKPIFKQSKLINNLSELTIIPETSGTISGIGLRYLNSSLEYSNNENEWVQLAISNSVNSSPILFSSSDLKEGILTINHNLNQYPIGIDYTIMPKDIIFVDENTLQFDYSDQDSISGQIWFIGSTQEMLGE